MTTFLFSLAAAEGEREFHIHQPFGVFFKDTLFEINNMVITQWVIIAVLVALAVVINRAVINGRFTRLRGSMELLLDFLEGWFSSFIGSRQYARQYMPLLGTLFLFILFSNYLGVLPTVGYGLFAPTGRWGTTLGLGIVVAIAVQVIAIKNLGGMGWVKHLLHLGPLSILEEFVHPFSLSLRLFGNIFGEETLLAVIIFLAPMIAPIPIMLLSLIFGAIQAVVFTTLTAIYIGAVLESHGAHGHGHAHEGEAEHHPAPAH
ncbi:F-type H+-transporting ATPase subunit a [Symbiobacterium terraclitae]|uniref:ATP synthase subunit a n=1 Tax=Symbiobacterium terraclitae TaxID=557451 RepID=A0ABS4JW89_9FIRM|nr:F-type H+-transporting ATPase subunit a [Symbiobacterium terraclitae]